METNNKPDFEKMADYVARCKNGGSPGSGIIQESFKDGCEKIWNDYVIPKDTKIAELTEQNTALAESYSKLQVRFGESESENQALKSELDKAKEVLISASEFVPFYHMDIVVEIQHVLKDKR